MTIQSASRALSTLETLAMHPDGLTVRAMAGRLGIHLSTTRQLAKTLEAQEDAVRLSSGS